MFKLTQLLKQGINIKTMFRSSIRNQACFLWVSFSYTSEICKWWRVFNNHMCYE